jgi:hypothetical protein
MSAPTVVPQSPCMPPPFDGPGTLVRLRWAGIRIKDFAREAGLNHTHVHHILHGHYRAGYYAAARLHRAARTLGLDEGGPQ